MFNKPFITRVSCTPEPNLTMGISIHKKPCRKITLAELQAWGTEALEQLESEYRSFVTHTSKRIVWAGSLGASRKK